MNLLLTEIRAHLTFSFTERLLRDPELFRERRDEALLAAELVSRIRSDEAIHVESLRLYLGELRAATFRTRDGGTLAGAEVIDRLWSGIVRWWTVEQPPLAAAQQREMLRERIHRHPDGARICAAQKAEQLWRYLTRRHKRRRPRRSRPSRDTIKDRVSIHERPKNIDARTEAGHWEGDLIICKRTRPVLISP